MDFHSRKVGLQYNNSETQTLYSLDKNVGNVADLVLIEIIAVAIIFFEASEPCQNRLIAVCSLSFQMHIENRIEKWISKEKSPSKRKNS